MIELECTHCINMSVKRMKETKMKKKQKQKQTLAMVYSLKEVPVISIILHK